MRSTVAPSRESMSAPSASRPWWGAVLSAAMTVALATAGSAAEARVTRIVIDARADMAPVAGQAPYEEVAGRAFGELDPNDPLNSVITDIELARDPDGKVRYEATFFITKPKNLPDASGLMWHEVPNRGRPVIMNAIERRFGDIGLASAWQGDDSGTTAINGTIGLGSANRHWLRVPVARNADGSDVTGTVFGRIVNRSGPGSQLLIVQSSAVPYMPATLDTSQAKLVSRTAESMEGVAFGEVEIPSSAWSWGKCEGEPDGLAAGPRICLAGGFDPTKLYQVSYTAKDPYVLGIGFAAWRDVGTFFKNALADDFGTPNPIASMVSSSIARGNSQSGNFLRGWLHMGFNQDEAQRQVHDGLWPIIAGRRIALNFRWAQPDGVLELYQAGSEGPQWWQKHPDHVRGLPPASILDRCNATNTCPKVIEHFGSAEIWGLKLGPEWVGTDASHDIPIPKNVRRYYIPSTTHGGTTNANAFNASLSGSLLSAPNCPGNNWGVGILPANPVPHVHTVNAIRVHFRDWVMQGIEPPPSRYPMLKNSDRSADGRGGRALRDLVEPTKAAMGFPTIPGLLGERAATVPEAGFINPVLDYDWGPRFNYTDASGIPDNFPPPIRQVIKSLVPRVNADGNEVGGVPVVLVDAPLGTYLGWNITAGGARPFHAGQLCNYAGGMIPFATTAAERAVSGDPRLSLEERYGNHAGYVAAVQKAAENAVSQGFLLQPDADALVLQAQASNVLKP